MTRRADRPFSPGFRLSAVDVGVLVAGAAVAVVVGRADRRVGLASAFVVGHFFLFCNVLRLPRGPELAWAGAFAAGTVAAAGGAVPWPAVFATSAALTVALAVRESRRPSYHGVGWRWFNPGLPQWWAGRQPHTQGRPGKRSRAKVSSRSPAGEAGV